MNKGQLHHSTTGLTERELVDFEAFFHQCQSRGLLERPAGLAPDDVLDGIQDETTLLRFLRGRSFDVPGALKQFGEAQTVRYDVDAAAAYEKMDIQEFEQARNMYPHWTGQRTKHGLPICIFDVAHLDHSAISSYGKERTTNRATCRATAALDYLTRFVLPLCSAMSDRPDPDKPITSAVFLVDIANFSFKQAWNVRGYAQDISKLLATCYPETVDKVYVLNAPSAFSKIWGLLKKWIDPRTAEKLVIVPTADVLASLSETIDVGSIPERYGGRLKSQHGMTAELDDALKGVLGVNTLPTGPLKWTMDSNGVRTAVAVGSRNGVERRSSVADSGIAV